MRIAIQTFWTQKLGNSPEEYEDAFWYAITPQQCVVAVSDGATEASFSQSWAKILTRGFVQKVPECWSKKTGRRNYGFLQWLQPLQKEWNSGINFANLPWFAIDKAEKGAAASLLGLVINLEKQYWQAVAIGDSNLFIIRGGKTILSWPLWKTEQFGSSPYIVWSNSIKNAMTAEALQTAGGRVQEGDIFMLMTDALASMYLEAPFWVESQEDFAFLVAENRKANCLKNDDTTLVVVKIEEV